MTVTFRPAKLETQTFPELSTGIPSGSEMPPPDIGENGIGVPVAANLA